MGNSNSASLLDWIVITLRWVFLVAAIVWLADGIGLATPFILLLALAVIGNVAASLLTAIGRISRGIRLACVLGDMALAYVLVLLVQQAGSDIPWAGILPLVSAAFYFRWVGAILLTLLNLLIQGGLSFVSNSFKDPLVILQLGVLAVLYLVIGLVLAYAGGRLNRSGLNRGIEPLKKGRAAALNNVDPKESERRRTIYELLTALSSSLNYQKVLETALDLSNTALAQLNIPADKLFSAVLLFTDKDPRSPELSVATCRRLPIYDKMTTLPGDSGLVGKAIDEGTPVLSKEAKQDPELKRFSSLSECESAYCIPLRSGLDAYGVLLFVHPDVEFFNSDCREVLDIIGKQSVIAIQNARLYQDLEKEKNRMMEIQEESRKKLARDLHDGPTQSVSAIAMRVNFARRLLDRDIKATSEELYKIEELARRTAKEIRHMLFTLRPLALESQGLVVALEQMGQKMKETYGQNVIIQADERVVEDLETGKLAVVFYLAEEAVNNARKHAQAPHIWIKLKMLRDGLSLLEIEDDGVGFDVNAVDANYDSRGSLGMVNLRERTELVNGVLRIDSAKGRGTRVQIVIPLTEEAADLIRRGP